VDIEWWTATDLVNILSALYDVTAEPLCLLHRLLPSHVWPVQCRNLDAERLPDAVDGEVWRPGGPDLT